MSSVFVSLLLTVSLLYAGVVGSGSTLKKDFFDPSLLKIDTSKYLGTFVPNVDLILEDGKRAKLYGIISKKPTILVFSYYTCEGSCPIRIDNLNRLIRNGSSLKNRDFHVLVLSFDEKDTLKTLKDFKKVHGPFDERWVFALLPREAIDTLTGSVGFKFFYSERDKTFVHTNVYIFLSPDGRVTRYLFGIKPKERDVRISLAEAEQGRITPSSLVDLALLVCYTYDPSRSTFVINPTILFGGIGFVALGGVLFVAFVSSKLLRREVR